MKLTFKLFTLFLFFSIAINAQTLSIKVYGNCGLCQDRIEEASMKTKGVITAAWDEDVELLTITFDSLVFVEDELYTNIAAAGHDTDKIKATDAAYNALPSCCLFRKNETDNKLMGTIYEKGEKKKKEPLIGATVYWLNDQTGTTTDDKGVFTMPMSAHDNQLVVSYVGYENDTILIEKAGHVVLVMNPGVILGEVNVVRRRSTTSVSYISTIKTKQITSKELEKAACCNLSESFETNPSVDVSFTDAVTGTRTIEMLGLAGPNVQVTRELMPDIRGLSALTGFTYIPGPWVEGMQLNLGAGSVLNGYESITGQINVELRKPWSDQRLLVNGYANNGGRYEGNVVANARLSKKWLANILSHYSYNTAGHDRNNDGFMDMPSGNLFSMGSIWKYEGDNGNEGMIGAKVTQSKQESGQDHHTFDHSSGDIWRADSDVNRYELWFKRGKVFKNKPYRSVGFQFSSVYHDQKSTYGKTVYNGVQKSLYANLLYQTILGDTDHKIVFGSSFVLDDFNESAFGLNYLRNEVVPGVFSEYTQKFSDKVDLLVGLRVDHHNNFGTFITPRLHLRYALNEHDVFRLSFGRGQRTANIFAENIGLFATSRKWMILEGENSQGNPYNLNPEIAWNYGTSFSKCIEFQGGEVDLSADYFYTKFENQIVADFDNNPQQFLIYNLAGKSYSHSLQTQADFAFENGFDVRAAYRFVNVKTDYLKGLLEKPLISPHRAFINLAYHTHGWGFDYTLNWQSSKRLPNTASNPLEYRRGDRSPSFFLTNAQITKSLVKGFEMYFGGENLLNYKQKNPIIASNDPNGLFFDSSMVWGPVFGRTVYVGFRYKIVEESPE